ncbi:hypothetical protein GC176_07390 [bacterium]|nr:hypothetical protein [bacterium]
MRLTLRTLLAYLDDILEPAQAREIGAKISESGYASSLVEHIREVMRQRRLGAPDASGPGMGLDPNAVAEYLDNTLTPEDVADIEKVCLESDLHLAEVAACHQILTIVLGEPVDVPERTRERMYVLGSVSSSLKVEADARSNGEAKQPVPSVTSSPQPKPESQKPREFEGVPDYLRPTPVWRRVGPIVVGLVVLGVWLLMVSSDPSINRSTKTPSSESGEQVVDASGASGDGSAAGIADGILSGAGNEVPENSKPESKAETAGAGKLLASTGKAPSIRDLDGFDPAPPADAPETGTPAATSVANANAADTSRTPTTPPVPEPAAVTTPGPTPATVSRTTQPTTVAAVTPGTRLAPSPDGVAPAPATTTENPAAAVSSPAGPQFQPAPEMLYASRDGIFLSRTEDGWRAIPHRAALRAGDALAAPEPFASLIDVASLGLTIEAFGGTAFEVLGSTAENQLVLRMTQGRLAFQNRAITDPDKPATISVQIGDERFHLVFSTENSVCGLEVMPTEPQKFEQPPVDDQYVGNLFVARGAVNVSVGKPGGRLLAAPAWLPLTVSVRKRMEEAGEDVPILPVPEWLDLDAERLTPAQRRYATRFEKELDPEVPIHLSVPAIVDSKVPDLSTLAVKCLGVTGLAEPLVEALSRVEFVEARDAAAQAIRQWLPRDQANKVKLQHALEMNFPPEQIEPIYRLLWGYDEADAENAATSQILVDWLSHDSEVIRQLAFFHIYRLTGQKYDYRPNNPEDQRRAAVKRWEAHLSKHSGKLLP